MKHLANWITASRIAFAFLLLAAEPFSPLFWAGYLCGCASDLIDGPVARKLHQQTETGAKLDSAADLAFILCIGATVLRGIAFPAWALAGMGVVALVHFTSYGVGYRKYRTFAALHTVLNKAAGLLLMAFPVLFALLGIGVSLAVLGAVALLAAVEELVITLRCAELDRDRKGLWLR